MLGQRKAALLILLQGAEMPETQLVQVKMTVHQIKDLDALRRAEPDIPTRAEMVRRLVERASKAAKKKA